MNTLYLYRLKIGGSCAGTPHKGTASQEAGDEKSGGEGMRCGRSSSFFPRGFNADRILCTSLSVSTA